MGELIAYRESYDEAYVSGPVTGVGIFAEH